MVAFVFSVFLMSVFMALPGVGKAQSVSVTADRVLTRDTGLSTRDTGLAAKKGTGNESVLASTTIVISQAYGGGGGATGTYLNDYVELKNVSALPQSLSGLSLMYGSATGQFGSSATNIFALPATTLAPGQYYLVQLSTAGTGGVALPVTPDATTTNLSMSGVSGKVALVTAAFAANTCGATATPCTLPNAGIVDLVAWGLSNNAEGGASTNGGAVLVPTQGNVRNGAGCTDTDNNNANFTVVTAPVPRNSSTPAAPCTLAAGVSISGRIMNGERGIRNARVTISGGALAEPITVMSGPKGQFTFNDIPAGRAYVVSVAARRFQFSTNSQIVEVNDNVAGINFFADDSR